jgi:hypothetical protein
MLSSIVESFISTKKVNVASEQISDLKERLKMADAMPEIPYMVNKELDLEELDMIHPDTWKNISWLIQDAIKLIMEKLADTRWAIEPVQ